VAPSIGIEVPHRVAQRIVNVEPAEGALEISEAQDLHRLVEGASRRAAEEGGDRGGDPRDRADPAGNLLDVHAWIAQLGRHEDPF
jgi:hypothetical protein